MLSNKNIDVNRPVSAGDFEGYTTFDFALEKSNLKQDNDDKTKILELFVNHKKIDVAQVRFRKTALHFVAQNGLKKIFETLVEMGVNIDSLTTSGCTALHCAAHSGRHEFIWILVENGANIELITSWGETACEIANEKDHQSIVKFLIDEQLKAQQAGVNAIIQAPVHAQVLTQ